jgi:MinD superfamily P-loop ATPase
MPRQELPEIDERRCTLCGDCVMICPTDALQAAGDRTIVVQPRRCISCAVCEPVCPVAAIAMRAQDW